MPKSCEPMNPASEHHFSELPVEDACLDPSILEIESPYEAVATMQGTQHEDPLKQLADKLRSKNGIEERAAVLADQRVDAFRGKEFAAYLRQHEELMQPFVSKGKHF